MTFAIFVDHDVLAKASSHGGPARRRQPARVMTWMWRTFAAAGVALGARLALGETAGKKVGVAR